jgi:hypothetical protein
LTAVVEEMSDCKYALNIVKDASTAAFMNIKNKFQTAVVEDIYQIVIYLRSMYNHDLVVTISEIFFLIVCRNFVR